MDPQRAPATTRCPSTLDRFSLTPHRPVEREVLSIRDELAAFNEEFADALEMRDPERVAQLYAEDAVFLSQGAATVAGRDEIRELLLRMPSAPERITFETGEVIEDGDLVIDVGVLLAGGARFGRYVVVYRRQEDGSLKLAVDVPLSDH